VVFTTDHGEYMGEHGLQEENQLYETAYRIPLLVRLPGAVPAGTTIRRGLSTVDFQPTILGLMGVPTCGREQDHDASPFLRGEDREWREEAMLHHCTHERAGIFTPEYELALVPDRDCILFDRQNDPLQMNNLFDDPAYGEVREDLTRRVILHHVETNSPAARWMRKL
jgi:arylsulfatase A-like enzyme